MATLLQDFRYGVRVLRSNPGLATVAVLTLALGIAVNTTVFSWIDGVLLHPLPGVTATDRLVALGTVPPDGRFTNISYLDHRDFRDNLNLVSGTAAWTQATFTVGDGESAQRVWGELVTGNYFTLLGVKPVLGRVFSAEKEVDRPGANPVVVISHRLWRSRFQADPRVIGRTLRVNRHELTIVGVAAPEFCGGTPGVRFELWVPFTMAVELKVIDQFVFTARRWRGLFAFARLKPGVSIEQARAEVSSVARRMAEAYPKTNQGFGANLLPIRKSPIGAQALLTRPLQILMAVSLLVFMVVCANVANLLLARYVSRQKELGIRAALGAGRARLARQLLTETLVVAAAGAVASLPLTAWLGDSLRWLLPPSGLPVGLGVRFSGQAVAFTILLVLIAALVSGVAPALFSRRSDPNKALKDGERGGSSGSGSHRLRGLLVISEIALAAVALIGAGLFARSFQNAAIIRPGFDASHVLLSRIYLPGYTADQTMEFCRRLRERLGSGAGISEIAYADTVPLGFGADPGHDIQVPGYVPSPAEYMNFSRTLATPGYFRLMRIPLLEGREFAEADDQKAPRVIIVNQTFARRFFGDSNPIGRQVRVADTFMATVVGLVKDIKNRSLTEPSQPHFYLPFAQRYQEGRDVALFLRGPGDPAGMARVLRREAAAIEPAVTFDAIPLAQYITASLYPQKVAAVLLTALGLVALLVAAAGLYSVMTYMVNQRAQEMGIRMALGARPGDVVGAVVRQGLALACVGLLAGIALALAAARVVSSQLVDLSVGDLATFAGAPLFLGAVALLASYVPARRASRVDPMLTLRSQ